MAALLGCWPWPHTCRQPRTPSCLRAGRGPGAWEGPSHEVDSHQRRAVCLLPAAPRAPRRCLRSLSESPGESPRSKPRLGSPLRRGACLQLGWEGSARTRWRKRASIMAGLEPLVKSQHTSGGAARVWLELDSNLASPHSGGPQTVFLASPTSSASLLGNEVTTDSPSGPPKSSHPLKPTA